MAKRISHDEFVARVAEINPSITVIGEYKDMRTKIECVCELGHHWFVRPDGLMAGYGCNKCAAIERQSKRRKSHQQFIDEVKTIHPDIKVLDTYVNSETKIQFMCSLGHIWKARPCNVLYGNSCPLCANINETKTHKQFVSEMNNISSDIIILGEYQNAHSKILCKCKKCQNEWGAEPSNLLKGTGCPRCCKSKGEIAIELFLTDKNISFEGQKKFDDCRDKNPLPFDFYLPDYKLCIEYQGEQHYVATRRMGDEEKLLYRQEHDCIKREYCKTKGINLLEIPYTNLKQIPEILTDVIKTGDSKLLNTKLGGVNTWRNHNA